MPTLTACIEHSTEVLAGKTSQEKETENIQIVKVEVILSLLAGEMYYI